MDDKNYDAHSEAKNNDYKESQDQAYLNDRINKDRDKSEHVNRSLEAYAESYKTRKLDYQVKKIQEEKQIAALRYEKAREIQQGIEQLKKLSGIFLIFAIISFIAMWKFDSNAGTSYKADLPPSGAIIGPLIIPKDKSVYLIKVSQPVAYYEWSYVSGTVLDVNKQPLFEFGKDFWDDYGYDDGGYWHESDTSYDLRTTFPTKGTYYLQFESEESMPVAGGNISIEIVPKLGSSLPFVWLGIICSILSLSCFGIYLYQNKSANTITAKVEKAVFKCLFYVALIAISVWAEM